MTGSIFLLLAAVVQSAPDGRVPITLHSAATLVETFGRLCVAADGDPQRQERLALTDGFKPVRGPASPPPGTFLARRSIGFTLQTRGEAQQCSVSGLAMEALSLDQLGALVTTNLRLAPNETAVMGSGQFARAIALWRPLRASGDSWAYASASPQPNLGGSAATQIVLTLVTSIKATQ